MTNLVRQMKRNDPFNPLPKRRWKRGEPNGRELQIRRDGALVTITHPTKGFRSRYWPRAFAAPWLPENRPQNAYISAQYLRARAQYHLTKLAESTIKTGVGEPSA